MNNGNKRKSRHFIIALTSFLLAFTMICPVWADTGSSQQPSGDKQEVTSTETKATQAVLPSEDKTDTTDQTTAPAKPATQTKLNGWQTINGYKYYYDSKSKPVTGIRKISGKVYSFGTDGKLNTGDSGKMDVKAYSQSSKTKYLILVNCTTHKVGVYKGKKANWKRLYYWNCGDGKKSTPTVKGTFKTGKYLGRKYKQKYFDSEGARCWYATRIYNGYLFHSVLYVKAKKPKKIKDGRLGEGVSHGCVRLSLGNAKWIYNHINKNTKVIIYK